PRPRYFTDMLNSFPKITQIRQWLCCLRFSYLPDVTFHRPVPDKLLPRLSFYRNTLPAHRTWVPLPNAHCAGSPRDTLCDQNAVLIVPQHPWLTGCADRTWFLIYLRSLTQD